LWQWLPGAAENGEAPTSRRQARPRCG